MIKPFFEGEDIRAKDFSSEMLAKGEYENCEFVNCSFVETDLSDYNFIDCLFESCDLSAAIISNVAFSNVRFKDCKLLGLQFNECHEFLFSVQFENCQLNLSSFYQRKLKKVWFRNCLLQEVDFAEADLSSALFSDCDLSGAIFDHTNLQKADFSSAFNYRIDPDQNIITNAQFSKEGLSGLLTKYNIKIRN